MAKVHLLGTGAALSDKSRTTTMLALEGEESLLLVDCGGDAAQRLLANDLDLTKVSGLIATHEHADHIGGFALLMERLWLAGHKRKFDVFGIRAALDQARRVHDAFDTAEWPGYPEIRYHEVERALGAPVLTNEDFEITAVPGDHAVPVIGLRVTDKRSGSVLAYSCDTEFSEMVVEGALGADLLVHEASGAFPGHSTGADAAAVASRAGAKRLVLVHIPPQRDGGEALLASARAGFAAAELGADGDVHEF